MLSRLASSVNHRLLPKSLGVSQKITCRSMHVTCRIINNSKKTNSLKKLSRYSPVFSTSLVRNLSNDVGTQTPSSGIEQEYQDAASATTSLIEAAPISLLEKIPDAPLPPSVVEAVDILKEIGEPSFSSIGLGGWSPVGIVQQILEYVHVGCGLPWWATIALGTVCVRTFMFPLVILSQRNAAKMHNSLPGMQKIQERVTEARNCGDHVEAAKSTQELMLYMKNNDCSPMRSMIVPLCQAPVFISFFFALKGMANLPVDSMRHGGMYWFTDLTVPDPYYILPIITAGSLSLILQLGVDGPKLANMGILRYIIQAIPIIILPFTVSFPGAIVWYWTSTNLFSIVQVGILKIPRVREYFKIAPQVTHAPTALKPKKNFKEGFQETWTNMKLAREMTDRQQLDRIQFNKAGRGPIEKTYAYNPIKEHLKKEILAKKPH